MRQDLKDINYTVNRFNPRTRMGCDMVDNDKKAEEEVSIHAPAWGATVMPYSKGITPEFQSTHPHGVRRHE